MDEMCNPYTVFNAVILGGACFSFLYCCNVLSFIVLTIIFIIICHVFPSEIWKW